ncbi:MAG: hypothetical protein H5T64_08675 [Chloroflexi bacterium]|nr:hypothetical protein [Chloroflexota bacterium]
MIRPDGTFDFLTELMTVVEDFLAEYERCEGPFRNSLEKGLVISYVLGTMRQDLDALWEALERAPVFRGVSPRRAYEEYGEAGEPGPDLLAAIRERGWVE